MYLIDKSNNRIDKIEQTTFKKEGFTERKHLQEWIANNTDCLQGIPINYLKHCKSID